jgi:hypothetical protein
MTTQHTTLLPIGQRVTHFDGGLGTHGKGTIIEYNGIQPDTYAQQNPLEAAQMVMAAAGADATLRSQLAGGLVNSFYDGTRCPYVVQWDPRNDDSEIGKKYPNGYKDVYELASINPILPKGIIPKRE